ncbi:hypothetical protein FE257_006935 [Aspergillus nanangensis]|uniref:Cellulose-binding protein n=1 Tax=Aspergillus nanangensis TaxID=2582783 RepID=A0AAD4CNP2_ASPNN|nr:hypothetical protein FE257_006935 [Aspergillus nanangensis]
MRSFLCVLLCALGLHIASTLALQSFPSKPRVFILSDISNEPDDAESLVRYLLYSNQFQTEGIVAVTSTWLKDEVHPEDMRTVIEAYGKVVDNLNQHAPEDSPYPTAEHLLSILKTGPTTYGMSAVNKATPLSTGAQLLLSRLETPSPDPLWVLAWGGTNVLAQALFHIHSNNPPSKAAELRARLRVYTISDQDDSGAWIRHTYPDISYIASVHGWNLYGLSAWAGISGEAYYGFDHGGPDSSLVSHGWIRENIQRGPLGAVYPDYKFIVEGDTPSFLYLVQNGLGVPENPEYGSWGGRYTLVNPGGEGYNHYADAADTVESRNRSYVSNQATIWRWRDAFQNDFAARIQWTLDGEGGNHHPEIEVNGTRGLEPLAVDVVAGRTVVFDAARTTDPDGHALRFRWFQYREPSATEWNTDRDVPRLTVVPVGAAGETVRVRVPAAAEACDLEGGECRVLHLVLEVTDDGSPSLTTYRRVLIQVVKS